MYIYVIIITKSNCLGYLFDRKIFINEKKGQKVSEKNTAIRGSGWQCSSLAPPAAVAALIA